MKKFELARRALRDLEEIWEFVSQDSFAVADRLLEEFYEAFGKLAAMPGMGASTTIPRRQRRIVLGASFLSGHLQGLKAASNCANRSRKAGCEEAAGESIGSSVRFLARCG